MGMQEMKVKHELESNIIPEINSSMNNITGGQVSIDIDWNSFTNVESMREIQYQILGRIEEAVGNICEDNFAKNIMKDGFKMIQVKNVASSDDRKVGFNTGTLTIQANWLDTWNIFSAADIRETIEKGL